MPQSCTYRKHGVDSGCLTRAHMKFRRKIWDGRERIGEEVMGVDFDLNTIYASMKLSKPKQLGLSALSLYSLTQRPGRER